MKKLVILSFLFAFADLAFGQKMHETDRLMVSPNGHFLQYQNGKPFFWLGDTGWQMFTRLTKDEITTYLDNRKQKGFNVIQAVVLNDEGGSIGPNRNGDRPLINSDPAKPNEAYFKMVDWAIQQAAKKQLYIGLLPTWGGNVSKFWSTGKPVFTITNAYQYGLFLGKRYQNYTNIIWIVGGDRPAKNDTADWRPIWRLMVKGIKAGAGNKVLITYHPAGESSSTDFWKDEATLDFNMMQSGHRIHDFPVWNWVLRDYNLTPAKPVLDGEPNYEDHPVNWKNNTGYFRDYDVRKQLYRTVFSGACGVTYGHQAVWQFYSTREEPMSFPDRYWEEALDRPGAFQAGYLKKLILSRPSLNRVPDQAMIKSGQGEKGDYITAFRDGDNGYAMVYLPVGKPIEVDASKLAAQSLNAWWFDPRTGKATVIGTIKKSTAPLTFTPPTTGAENDWVLVLDDAQKQWPVLPL
jgi:hypothetical protein